jgi:hypothetical protein
MSIIPVNYHQTLAELKQRISLAQYKSLLAVNQELILLYLDIGRNGTCLRGEDRPF